MEGRKESKRRTMARVDRTGVATRVPEAVYDAKMWKSFVLPPWRKEPKTEV